MKNSYLFVFFLIIGKSFGQDPVNMNWYFGKRAALNFATNPPTVLLNSNMDQREGCASVSNAFGNLLFYTDGVKVWNQNHGIMPNSSDLTGHLSSGQSAVIVPSQTNSQQYYIFTTPARNTSGTSFAYSVVDMELDDYNGDIVEGQKNIPLLDENGMPFTIKTEGLTVARNHNNTKYWILFPNNNKLYAYLVDSSGVSTTPVVSNMTFTNDQDSANSTLSCIKVSPNNDKIAISYWSYAWPPLQADQTLAQTRIYRFNSALGTISYTYQIEINNRSIYSLEFSPDSNLLFMNNSQSNLQNPRLMVYDLQNLSMREENIPLNIDIGTFQRAPNNEIYISGVRLNKITDPNDYFSSITYNVINVNPLSQPNRKTEWGLPQLIAPLDPQVCTEDILLNFESHQYFVYEASNTITTQNSYNVGVRSEIVQYAGNSILLKHGTRIYSGARYLGKIQPCDTSQMMSKSENQEPIKKVYNFDDEIYNEKLIVFPNPVDDFVNMTLKGSKIKTVLVQLLDGRIILDKQAEAVNSYRLDFSSYEKGIYILSVETTDGKIYSEKLIKK